MVSFEAFVFNVLFFHLNVTVEDDWRAVTQRLFNCTNWFNLMKKECYILLNHIMIKRTGSFSAWIWKQIISTKKDNVFIQTSNYAVVLLSPLLQIRKKNSIITPLDQKIILVIHSNWIHLFLSMLWINPHAFYWLESSVNTFT